MGDGEIEITREMRDAAKEQLLRYSERYHTEDTLVCCLFQAMVENCPVLKRRRVVHDYGILE